MDNSVNAVAVFLLFAAVGLAVIVFLLAIRLGQLTRALRRVQQQQQAHIVATGQNHE